MSLVGGSILRGRDDPNSDIAREYCVGRHRRFAITVPLRPRLRRIAIQFLKDISRGGGGGAYVRANRQTVRMCGARCSHVGPERCHAD